MGTDKSMRGIAAGVAPMRPSPLNYWHLLFDRLFDLDHSVSITVQESAFRMMIKSTLVRVPELSSHDGLGCFQDESDERVLSCGCC